MEDRGVEASIVDAARAGVHPPAAKPSSSRKRHIPTQEQKIAVAVLAGAAAIACAAASARPTGVSQLDFLYRAAFGAVMVLAASRSRRWALVLGSAVASAGAFGVALIPGIAALGLSLFLVGRNRRDRIFGAVVGLLVAVTSMHLSVAGFLGSSVVVAVVANSVILVSGYLNTSRRFRRWWRLGAAVAGLVVVVSAVLVGFVGATSVSSLRDGIDATRDGVNAASAGNTQLAAQRFRAAVQSFSSVSSKSNVWWMSIARTVPVLSQNLQVVQAASRSGVDLADVAADVAARVDYTKLQLPGGGVDVQLLASYQKPLLSAAVALDRSDRTIGALGSTWDVGPLDDRLRSFATKVHSYRNQAVLAALAVDRAPAMLGASGARHYLILLGNPAELRDIGGHLGNWAELTIDQGKLSLSAVGDPAALALPADSTALANASTYPPSLVDMSPLVFPQNWGADPDMSVVARLSAQLFKAKTGTTLDGVMYADPEAFSDFLQLTGPVPIPGLTTTLSASTAVKFLTQDQFSAYPTESAGNAALEALVQEVFQRVTTVHLPGPRTMADIFRPVVLDGRLKLVSFHNADELLLTKIGMDGKITPPKGGDLLGIINRNANPSKIDTYLRRSTTVSVKWNPKTGLVHEDVAVTLRNLAPASGLPQLVIGNQAGLPQGTNLTDLALISTYQLQHVELDGQQVGSDPVLDGRYWRYTVRVPIAPGGSDVVTYELKGAVAPSDRYQVFAIGQPIITEGPIVIHLQPTAGEPLPGNGIAVRNNVATIRLEDGVDSEVSVALK